MQVYIIVSESGLHGVFDSMAKAVEAAQQLSGRNEGNGYNVSSVTLNSAFESVGTWYNGHKAVTGKA